MIVVIEGMDAAGKQTHSKLLAEAMRGARFSFPNYESPTGSIILAHLKKWWKCKPDGGRDWGEADMEHLDARTFQSLQTVNRIEKLPDIHASIARGQHVVFDRYWQSAYVYGSLDGLDEAWLRLVQESPMPPADVNILIDVTVDEGFKRRPERRDRYETDRPFLERVRAKYLDLWGVISRAEETKMLETRLGWYVVDGVGGINQVHERIMAAIEMAKEVR